MTIAGNKHNGHGADGRRLYFKGGGNTTSTSKVEPPDAVKPYLDPFMKRASQIAGQPYKAYTGERLAGFSPEQEAAMNLTSQRALNGAPDINATRTNLAATMNGAYLSPDSNPYLKQTVNTALNDVQGRVNSTMRGTGGYGGSAHAETLTRALGDTAANMYGTNYTNERTNQMRGMAFAPQMAGMDYQDLQALGGVGDARQNLAQEALNQGYSNWLEAKNYPYQQLDVMGNAIRSTMGAGGTTTQTGQNMNKSSPIASSLGGAAMGYGLSGMLPAAMGVTGPIGAGIGAAAGLLGWL